MTKITIDRATLEQALEMLEGMAQDLGKFAGEVPAITAIEARLAQPEQKPVSMRMPQVGDRVICLEDESLGIIRYLTAGGSPQIEFDDGFYGIYLPQDFLELFAYFDPPATQPEQAKTIPQWQLKCQYVVGRGYVVWRDVFDGDMKCSLDEAITAHTQAVFVFQVDAKEYCNFKNNTPPAAQQQLTDEQIGKAWSVADGEHNASASVKRKITRAIEAELGRKEPKP
jgi:hypothetical protein